jgi:cation:H+ antiporter
VATTITSVVILNNPTLAVYNLLGSVALQTTILCAADWAKQQDGAMTYFSPRFVLLAEGVGLLLLLQLVIAGVSARGFPTVASISVWSALIFVAYLGVMYLTYRQQGHPRWTPTTEDDLPREEQAREDETQRPAESENKAEHRSLKSLWLRFSEVSLVVFAGGWIAAHTADVLAGQTGLSHAFLGATLLALATSLPELSTTIAAARNRRYSMAFSNIFGSNAFSISLLFLADLLYRGGTILEQVQGPVVFVAAIGAVLTCVYLWGMMERENKTILSIGWDSAAALIVYLGAMTALYFME